MLKGFDVRAVVFAEPAYLWLLLGPACLLVLWLWRVVARRADARRLRRQRLTPTRLRVPFLGDLGFWLFAILAISFCVVALARPQAQVRAVRQSAADIVILQDGSASMYVTDVSPDRWQRSVRFIRTFAETLSWKGDRVALALFAQLAAPQVRLTKDPNALFFFLDHLGEHSPFRLEDNPTWDTNIEEGVYWGLKIVQEDERMSGKKNSPKAFVVISDGQAWSGDVANALQLARQEGVLVYVVGVGTSTGGIIPEPPIVTVPIPPPIRASLDRESLVRIARAGGGEYYDLGGEPDRDIAARIISSIKRRAPAAMQQETFDELYGWCLWAAVAALCLGTLTLRRQVELWQVTAAMAVTILVVSLLIR